MMQTSSAMASLSYNSSLPSTVALPSTTRLDGNKIYPVTTTIRITAASDRFPQLWTISCIRANDPESVVGSIQRTRAALKKFVRTNTTALVAFR